MNNRFFNDDVFKRPEKMPMTEAQTKEDGYIRSSGTDGSLS